jgi:hypothetical protein
MIENVTAAAPVPAMNSLLVIDLFFMIILKYYGLCFADYQLLIGPGMNFCVHAI